MPGGKKMAWNARKAGSKATAKMAARMTAFMPTRPAAMSMILPWRCGSWRSQTPVTTARISATTVTPARRRTSLETSPMCERSRSSRSGSPGVSGGIEVATDVEVAQDRARDAVDLRLRDVSNAAATSWRAWSAEVNNGLKSSSGPARITATPSETPKSTPDGAGRTRDEARDERRSEVAP